MVLGIDAVEALLNELLTRFPEGLFDELNGGINLLEETMADPEVSQVWILGEYCNDQMGQYINLYYGSFATLAELEQWEAATWREELLETMSHELTHHMEWRSGTNELEKRDALELAQFLNQDDEN